MSVSYRGTCPEMSDDASLEYCASAPPIRAIELRVRFSKQFETTKVILSGIYTFCSLLTQGGAR